MKTFLKYLTLSAAPVLLLFLAVLLLNSLHLTLPLSMVSTTRSSELAVNGSGKIEVAPDIAYVDAGITVSSAPTVAEVQQKINTVNNKILDAVKALGIPKEDIKTSNYSINPQYDPIKGTQSTNAYTGNANVRVKVRDIEKVSQIVSAVTGAGANQIMGVSYSIDDLTKYREEARNKAIDNAKEEAQKLAANLGLRLGKVTNIVEGTTSGGPYPMLQDKMAMSVGGTAEAGANFAPGTQTVESTVTVYFEK